MSFNANWKMAGSLIYWCHRMMVDQNANLKILSEEAICFLKNDGDDFYFISLLSDDLRVLSGRGKVLS